MGITNNFEIPQLYAEFQMKMINLKHQQSSQTQTARGPYLYTLEGTKQQIQKINLLARSYILDNAAKASCPYLLRTQYELAPARYNCIDVELSAWFRNNRIKTCSTVRCLPARDTEKQNKMLY